MIGGLRQIEEALNLPSSLMDREERKLINLLRENNISFQDAADYIAAVYDIG